LRQQGKRETGQLALCAKALCGGQAAHRCVTPTHIGQAGEAVLPCQRRCRCAVPLCRVDFVPGVAAGTAVAVPVVPIDGEDRAMLPIKTILHPTDFSELSHAAFQLACALARDHKGRLVVLHVVPPPQSHGEVVARQQGEGYHKDLWRVLERMRPGDGDLPLERRLEDGDPAEMILRVADEEGASLIVLGTHGRGPLGKLLLGSVADKVVRRAPCPVLTTNGLSNRGGVP
jgi:universal stress protein A